MLPSPIIEGTLPAFYLSEDGTARVAVPFSMSRAVNRNEVQGFKLKIKNLQGSQYILTLPSTSFDFNTMQAIFYISKAQIEAKGICLGSFYKAQLAYVDLAGAVGYYSTVGIIKYTACPQLSIAELTTSKNNTHRYAYTGVYSQENRDPTEKVYAYRFIVKNNQDELIEDTGYLVHNSSSDVKYYESSDTFNYNYDLELNDKYTITYMVKTNNGLELSGPSYRIVQKETLPISTINKIFPVADNDNGVIEIFFNVNPRPSTNEEYEQAQLDKANEEYVKGTFILSRSSEDTLYQNWETVVEFSLFAQKPSTLTWKDFTVAQGKKYKYAVQQYSKENLLYSNRLMTDIITIDFEDIFLYDGNKQLKIRFNPKMNSFKKNILESKVDTLGSKYPFIFRNGNVEYKEFPISGLISYLMDDQALFSSVNLSRLSTKNSYAEREYLEVYEPYVWRSSSNAMIDKALKKAQYQKDYKALYIKDSASDDYISWVKYLETKYAGALEEYSRFYDWSDYDRYFENDRKYYTRWTTFDQNNNDFRTQLIENKINFNNTDLTGYNTNLEREFKMEVFDWLTNGEPKLFRSPTEGNFIIRLMNVSLSPEERLGRMLHNFSSTAYEIDDFSYDSLKEYGFLNTQYFKNSYFKIQSTPIVTRDESYYLLSKVTYLKATNDDYYYASNLMPEASSLEFVEIEGAVPGTLFFINGKPIVIGASGYYRIDLPVESLEVVINPEASFDTYFYNEFGPGIVTYGFYSDIDDTFSYISNVDIKEICGKQFIGNQLLRDSTNRVDDSNDYGNIISLLTDVIKFPTHYYEIKAQKRPIVNAYEWTSKIKALWEEAFSEDVNIGWNNYQEWVKFMRDDEFGLKREFFKSHIFDINLFQYSAIGDYNEETGKFDENVEDSVLGALYTPVHFGSKTNYSVDMYSETEANRNDYYRPYVDIYYTDWTQYQNHGAPTLYTYVQEDDEIKDVNEVFEDGLGDDPVATLKTLSSLFIRNNNIEYIYDFHPLRVDEDDNLIYADSNKTYLSDYTYGCYSRFWESLFALGATGSKYYKKNSFNINYDIVPYTIKIRIDADEDEETVDIYELNDYTLTDFTGIDTYAPSAGVYIDITYTEQTTNYDLSRDVNMYQTKKILEAYDDILSYERAKDYADQNKLTYQGSYYTNKYPTLTLNSEDAIDADDSSTLAVYQTDPCYEDLMSLVSNGSRKTSDGLRIEVSYEYSGSTIIMTQSREKVYASYLAQLETYVQKLKDFYGGEDIVI